MHIKKLESVNLYFTDQNIMRLGAQVIEFFKVFETQM